MNIFIKTYEWVLSLSKHPNALFYLVVISFIDSSFFPISPLLMLIPMAYAEPNRAFYFALVSTLSSIAGGILGYGLGFLAFEAVVEPFIHWMGYMEKYQNALVRFNEYGFWAVLVGAFSPVPYKIFTIGAGVLQLNLPGFLIASTLGRGLKLFLLAALIRWGGPKVEPHIRRMLLKMT